MQHRDGFRELYGLLRARLATLAGAAPTDGEVALIFTRLEWIAAACPLHVLVASFRSVCNAWATNRRFGSRGARCMLGCQAVDADDLRHYVQCPVLSVYVAPRPDLIQPVWTPSGLLFLFRAMMFFVARFGLDSCTPPSTTLGTTMCGVTLASHALGLTRS